MANSKKRKIKPANDEVALSRGAQPERSTLRFDPWLSSGFRVVSAIVDNVEAHYHFAPRRRRMKERDRKNLKAVLHAVLSNIAYAIAAGADPPTIGISLRDSKQRLTRYDRKGFTGLPRILGDFDANGTLLKLHKSRRKGIASQIELNPGLVEDWRRFRFRPEQFTRITEGREVVCLSRTERDYVSRSETRELTDYIDTDQSRRYRSEVQKINAFLAAANLKFVPDGGPFVATELRQLRRHFNLPPRRTPIGNKHTLPPAPFPQLPLGGRLFGGWWQDLPKARRHSIRIDGEPVADLDFRSMFLRLAYHAANAAPPDMEDLYAVPGFTEAHWREGVKKVANAMLFRSTPLVRLPRDVTTERLLPSRVRGARVRAAILEAHPKLAGIFETGIGLSLMFTESQILIGALLRLIKQGIPALPMHDGLMVAASKAPDAMNAMWKASQKVTGLRLPIRPEFLSENYGPP